MSKFFINRPIFATVLSILIVVAGLVTLKVLPIAQYPEITPPTVVVSAFYPGASAETIAQTVGQPIEQKVNGVEGMLYMSSVSSGTGTYTLTITFDVGTDIDMATVLVQNRVSLAMNSLPSDVTRLGITTKKKSSNIVMFVSLKSNNPRYDGLFLSNYARLNVVDELSRLDGVGEVSLFGAEEYSMRIWLDPDKLYMRGLTPADVSNAIGTQNMQVSAGKVGEEPTANPKPTHQYTLNVKGRLEKVEDFGNLVVKSTSDGKVVRLKDISVIELGSKNYMTEPFLKGKPTAAISIYQLPGANALALAEEAKAKMEDLKAFFPEGIDYEITLDTTDFVRASIDEVYKTLFEAIILVLIVIMVFLQNWRAILIPTLTIPVSLVGTFAAMQLMGFSINTLTMFGLILAIGIVVDDAIVVVENVSRHLEEDPKMTPKEATLKAMEEVTGPVVGVVLVLLAVFIPTAFIGGLTGELYKQFALTIAVSTVLSGVCALTLSPALCALILRAPKESTFIGFKWFNRGFEKLTNGYSGVVGAFLKRSKVTLFGFLILASLAAYGFIKWPTSFVPSEDQGYFMANIQLQDASSLHETKIISDRISKEILDSLPGVKNYMVINGFSMIDGAQSSNCASIFVMLKDWSERTQKEEQLGALIDRYNQKAYQMNECISFAFSPPAISGLGAAGGFEFVLQDRGNLGTSELQTMARELCEAGNSQSSLSGLRNTFRADIPQLYLDIDRDKVDKLGLVLGEVFQSLSAYMGSAYINDFVKFGRTYQVKIEAGALYRSVPEDVLKLAVRNHKGQMIPFSSFASLKKMFGPETVQRYNLYTSTIISGNASQGKSSGEAIAVMESMSKEKMGSNFSSEWTSMAYQEQKAGSSIVIIFALAILIVFLVLSAQYESWTSPMAVIMGVPVALLGVVIGCIIMKQPISIYTQIGVILLIALSAKNAILIVEFARDFRLSGKGIAESALEAGRVRFRPILMTSFAFILGVYPLVVAEGAGAASRVSLGVAVFFGMLATVFLGTLFIPNFYKMWQEIQEGSFWKKK